MRTMKIIAFLLNFFWTIFGCAAAVLSIPVSISIESHPAIIFKVRNLWWWAWIPGHKSIRAMAIGNVVLLGPKILVGDREHELVHVNQAMSAPFIFPILYQWETMKNGYRRNRYEREVYSNSKNLFIFPEK